MKKWIERAEANSDLFIDLVRIYLGIGLMVKGLFFLMNQEALLRLLEQSDNLWVVPSTAMHLAIPIHILGGFLLAIGLVTRAAALIQIPILLGATFFLFLPRLMFIEERQHFEFSALVLFLLTLIFVFGPRRLSLDHYLLHRQEKPGKARAPKEALGHK